MSKSLGERRLRCREWTSRLFPPLPHLIVQNKITRTTMTKVLLPNMARQQIHYFALLQRHLYLKTMIQMAMLGKRRSDGGHDVGVV
mmetsp:Transcript_24845/g.44735  ORF Transcript_24845/g.44735 Transcript_24845/m.44735 type:complete len:86 (+) Transcript_24845:754-1011(+)